MMNLDSLCPEASRIFKRVFLTLWRLEHKMQEVSGDIEDVKFTALQEEILRNQRNTEGQGNIH
jgi:hypothetical protein